MHTGRATRTKDGATRTSGARRASTRRRRRVIGPRRGPVPPLPLLLLLLLAVGFCVLRASFPLVDAKGGSGADEEASSATDGGDGSPTTSPQAPGDEERSKYSGGGGTADGDVPVGGRRRPGPSPVEHPDDVDGGGDGRPSVAVEGQDDGEGGGGEEGDGGEEVADPDAAFEYGTPAFAAEVQRRHDAGLSVHDFVLARKLARERKAADEHKKQEEAGAAAAREWREKEEKRKKKEEEMKEKEQARMKAYEEGGIEAVKELHEREMEEARRAFRKKKAEELLEDHSNFFWMWRTRDSRRTDLEWLKIWEDDLGMGKYEASEWIDEFGSVVLLTAITRKVDEDPPEGMDRDEQARRTRDWLASQAAKERWPMERLKELLGEELELVLPFVHKATSGKWIKRPTEGRTYEDAEGNPTSEWQPPSYAPAAPKVTTTASAPTAGDIYTYEQVYEETFRPEMEEYDLLRFDPYSFSGAPLGGWGRATRSRLAALPIRLVSDFDGGMDLLYAPLGGGEDGDGMASGEEDDGGKADGAEPRDEGESAESSATKASSAVEASAADVRLSVGPHYAVRDAAGQKYVCRAYDEDEVVVLSRIDSAFHPAVTIWDEVAATADGKGADGGDADDGGESDPAEEADADKDGVRTKEFHFSVLDGDGDLSPGVRSHVAKLLRQMGMGDVARAMEGNEVGANVELDVEVVDLRGQLGDVGANLPAEELHSIVQAAALGAAGFNDDSKKKDDAKGSADGKGAGLGENPVPPAQLTPKEIHAVLSKLEGMCSQLHLGWWSYEWCHEMTTRQFHVAVKNQATGAKAPEYSIEDVTLVGRYGGEVQIIYPRGHYGGVDKIGKTTTVKFDASGNVVERDTLYHTDEDDVKYSGEPHFLDNKQKVADLRKRLGHGGPIIKQVFKSGDYCPEAEHERSMSVELRCCTEEEIDLWLESKKQGSTPTRSIDKKRGEKTPQAVLVSVQEEETCVYRSRVCTPLLCPKLSVQPDAAGKKEPVEFPDELREEARNDPIGSILRTMLGDDVVGNAGEVRVFLPDDDTGLALDELIRQAENGGDFLNDPSFHLVKEALRNSRTLSKTLNAEDFMGKDPDKFGVLGIGKSKAAEVVKEGDSIREILAKTLGKRACLVKSLGWWTYEFCHTKRIRQYHANNLMDVNTGFTKQTIETENLLGIYAGSGNDFTDYPNDEEHLHVMNATGPNADWKEGANKRAKQNASAKDAKHAGGNGAVYLQEYSHGDVCDHEDVAESVIKGGNVVHGSVERSSTVRFSCGKQLELVDIKEDSTCHYILDVSVPELCDHKLFKAPVTKTQVVKCLPV